MLYGNAIVGQSGGPTAAINATLAGVIKGVQNAEAIRTIYGAFNGIEGILNGTICNLSEIVKSGEDIKLLSDTPAAALGSCRMKLPKVGENDDVYVKLFEFFRSHDIRYFFYIGGNDSMDTVAKLADYARTSDWELRVIGVPKTIDNDLTGTDHTPGYGSAAKYIAVTMSEIIRDCAVYTTKAVTIVEIMGRDAGWLTAAAALPRIITGEAPDMIYLPEAAFNTDEFFEDVTAALSHHPNVVIAISEGIRSGEGCYIGAAGHKGVDVFGHINLSGAGKALEFAVKEKLGCKVRSIELNLPQRCAAHLSSATDISESLAVGEAAVSTAVKGGSGLMMCYERVDEEEYKINIVPKNIADIANMVRAVPRSFINERGNNVTDACANYIKPLIQGEIERIYKNGLPVHFTIKR